MICGPRSAMRARDRGEHGERREAHHIVGNLEHHAGRAISTPADDRLAAFADGSERDPEEYGEDDDRQDLVVAHRLEDRLRDEVGDEVLEVERRRFDAARRHVAGGIGRFKPDTRMEERRPAPDRESETQGSRG